MYKKLVIIMSSSIASFLLPSIPFAQSELTLHYAFDAGGGVSSSGNSRVISVIGETFVGKSGSGDSWIQSGLLAMGRIPTSIEETDNGAQPISFRLYQNYPNPFNPSTKIAFDVAVAGQVRVEVYDLHGRRIRTLVDERKRAGQYTISWNGQNENGWLAASGIYLIRLTAAGFEQTVKAAFVK